MSALKWQGWLVGLVTLAGLLVFAPLGLYVWASGGERPAPPPREAGQDVRVTGCRIDPASRRVVASVEATGRAAGPASYIVTVEFRDRAEPEPGARAAQALVKIPGVAPGAVEYAEALGPVWPVATVPWCGVAGAEFEDTP
uniref:Secreted protein n=1 Tax=Streptomyces sp. NBC_00049 TaxID=2903617 RepID=A0AAU2JU02_9ACTN